MQADPALHDPTQRDATQRDSSLSAERPWARAERSDPAMVDELERFAPEPHAASLHSRQLIGRVATVISVALLSVVLLLQYRSDGFEGVVIYLALAVLFGLLGTTYYFVALLMRRRDEEKAREHLRDAQTA